MKENIKILFIIIVAIEILLCNLTLNKIQKSDNNFRNITIKKYENKDNMRREAMKEAMDIQIEKYYK